MEKNEVKKYLYKNKELMAKFSQYIHGNLYYIVQLEDGNYEFPISTIDTYEIKDLYKMKTDENDNVSFEKFERSSFIDLSSDLGTTSFDKEVKASLLNRWIDKAIEKGEFIKI